MHPYTKYSQLFSWYYAYSLPYTKVVDGLFEWLYPGDGGPIRAMGYLGPTHFLLDQFRHKSLAQMQNKQLGPIQYKSIVEIPPGYYIDELNEAITDDHYAEAIQHARARIISANRSLCLDDNKNWWNPPGLITDPPDEFAANLTYYLDRKFPVYEVLFSRLDRIVTDDDFTYDGFMRDWHEVDSASTKARRIAILQSRVNTLERRHETLKEQFELADKHTPKLIVKTIAEFLQSLLDYMKEVGVTNHVAVSRFREDLHKMNQLLE